jgi:hypothetical protein
MCALPSGRSRLPLRYAGGKIGPDSGLCYIFLRVAVRARRRAKALRYVPPVRDQIAALRAHEVLVRGAGPPAASPGELLREAEDAGHATGAELLRPDEAAP